MKRLKNSVSPQFVLTLSSSLFLILLVFAWNSLAKTSAATDWLPPAERQKVDLSADLITVDAEPVALKDLDSKVLLVNFWATWCGPCRKEMPSIIRLWESYKDRGLEVVALTDEDPETIAAYLEKTPYPFRMVIDQDGGLATKLGVRLLPTSFVIDAQSRVVKTHEGAETWDAPEIRKRVEQLLNEAR